MRYTPNMLSYWLRDYIVFEHFGNNFSDFTGGIVFVEEGSVLTDSTCLYIGYGDHVAEVIENGRIGTEPLVILCAGSTEKLQKLEILPHVTIIACTERPITIYNRTQFFVHRFLAWDSDMRRIVYENEGLQTLLDCAFDMLSSDMALVNVGYRSLSGKYTEGRKNSLFSELSENGYLAFETVKNLQNDGESGDAWYNSAEDEYIVSVGGSTVAVWPIRHENTIVGRYVVDVSDEKSRVCSIELGRCITRYLKLYLTSIHGADYNANSAYGNLFADLVENRISGPEELQERLKQVPLAFKHYYRVLVVSFPDKDGHARGGIPWNYIISQLQLVFPFSNITVYRSKIVLLVRKAEYSPSFEFDREAVEKILRYYDGYMMIGNFSKFLTSLSSIYNMCFDCLRIAMRISRSKDERIFRYEDYSIYSNIELAGLGMKVNRRITNFVYLCHPSYIALLRYDRRQGTEYCKVLKTYLMCSKNAAEAARELYLHRNTMLYKISRIEEILGQKLDDPLFDYRLLYSCFVDEYVREYQGEDILQLKKNTPDDE